MLREDFCGTANTSCEWIKRRPDNRAVSIDIDPEVLEWARANNVARLRPSQRERIDIRRSDVMDFRGCKADIILAMNFSYQLFKTRSQLEAYFAMAREGLADDGVLFIDAYGGYESCRRNREKTRLEQFTYYWEQAKFDPISGHMLCYIHFRFDDKSWLKRAFSYCWRLYTLPELREILDEAGFSRIIVYWEGIDEETGRETAYSLLPSADRTIRHGSFTSLRKSDGSRKNPVPSVRSPLPPGRSHGGPCGLFDPSRAAGKPEPQGQRNGDGRQHGRYQECKGKIDFPRIAGQQGTECPYPIQDGEHQSHGGGFRIPRKLNRGGENHRTYGSQQGGGADQREDERQKPGKQSGGSRTHGGQADRPDQQHLATGNIRDLSHKRLAQGPEHQHPGKHHGCVEGIEPVPLLQNDRRHGQQRVQAML